jgi:hypothetical protein
MFWNKKVKEQEQMTLPTKEEAHALADENFRLILNGCIQAMAKDIHSAVRKGYFEVLWDVMPGHCDSTLPHYQAVFRNDDIRLSLCKHLEEKHYIVLWNEQEQKLRVKW